MLDSAKVLFFVFLKNYPAQSEIKASVEKRQLEFSRFSMRSADSPSCGKGLITRNSFSSKKHFLEFNKIFDLLRLNLNSERTSDRSTS